MASVAIRQPLFERLSWGALFAGLFFGFAIWMLLLALGAGVAGAAFNPTQWQGFTIGFGIWAIIAGIISFFLAGWLAARTSQAESRRAGMLHGATLWGFMMVVGVWVATMALAGTASAAASAAGGVAQTAGQVAGQAAASPQVQGELQQRSQELQQQGQQLAEQAQQQGGQAAHAARTAGTVGAWAFFVYAVLTLVAAILGGSAGVPKERTLTRREETVPVPPGAPPFSPQRA